MKRRLMMMLFTLLSMGFAVAADETQQQGDSTQSSDFGPTSEDCGPLW